MSLMSITFIFTFAAEHYALLFCLHQCRILLPFPSTSSSLDLLFIPLFFSPLFYTPISIFTPKSAFLILSYLLRSLLLSFFLSVSFQKNFSIFLISISLLYSLRSCQLPPCPFLHSPSFPIFTGLPLPTSHLVYITLPRFLTSFPLHTLYIIIILYHTFFSRTLLPSPIPSHSSLHPFSPFSRYL